MKITREMYKKIKKMDHREMETYLNNLYTSAHNTGVESVTKVITDKIINGLKRTKGIGEKRMEAILKNINEEMNR